jgi:membrane protease YdiL (CAAX protease family)
MNLFALGGILLTGYSILLIQFYRASKKSCNSTTDAVVKGRNLGILNQRHLVGGLAMLIPILYVDFTNSDWLLLHSTLQVSVWLITIPAGVAACILSVRAAQKALHNIPLLAATSNTAGTYLLLRGLFLICYELFFRGLLLSFCLSWASAPAAIVINVVLYALAHAFSTRQELLGTVPFGSLLCLLTLYAGSVWPAVIIHLLLGLPYDVYTLYAPKRAIKTSML